MKRREAAVIAFFVIASIVMTWPLALHLQSAVADPFDPFFSTWAIDWDYHATFTKASLFHANIFHPARYSFAFSEHMYGIAVLFFPLLALGVAPLTVHNLAVLLGFAACGYAMYLLARYVTQSTRAGVVGGVCYAFAGFRFHHLPHVHFIWSAWLPILLLTLLLYARSPRWPPAAAFAFAFFMNGITSLHWLVFGGVASAVTVAYLAIARRQTRWTALIVAAAVVSIALIPFVQPYRTVAKLYAMERSPKDIEPTSAQWGDWLQPNYQNRLYGDRAPLEAYGHERTLFPGFVTALLALIGLLAARRNIDAWSAAVWIAIGAFAARGFWNPVYMFLFEHSSAFRGIRMPSRWAMVAYVGFALFAALGAAQLMRSRRWIGVVIIAVALFELRVAPIRWYLMPTDVQGTYAWLRTVPIRGAIVELPLTQPGAYEYQWKATLHHKPLINGVSSHTPPGYDAMVAAYEASPIGDAFLDALEKRGCSLLVVHQEMLMERSAAVRDFLRRAITSGRLIFLRRFDHGLRSDYVFALTANEPSAEQWHEAESLDRSGRTPAQNLQVFLDDDGFTYGRDADATFDGIPFGPNRGPITIAGWALAPDGIAEVRLRLNNGTHTVIADRHERADVLALFPWYPAMTRAGFAKTIAAPPDGIRGDTDLQVELVTNNGKVRRLRPMWFRWYPPPAHAPQWKPDALAALVARLAPADSKAGEKLLQGRALIEDYTQTLVTDVHGEPDPDFVRRISAVLLGDAPDGVIAAHAAALARGATREEIVRRVIESDEFARRNWIRR